MTRWIMSCSAILSLATVAAVSGDDVVAAGATRDSVIATLGEPSGVLNMHGREFLLYERGRIELEDGIVTKATLISAEAAEKQRLQREQAEEVARQNAALDRQRRIKTGRALLEAKQSDGEFLASPARERVAYWKWFRRVYPEVDVSALLTRDLKELEAELAVAREEQNREREMAELTARVAAAEVRAAEAEREASRRNRYEYGYPYYPVVWQPQPVCPEVKPKPKVCIQNGISATVQWGAYSEMDRVGVFKLRYPPTVSGSGYF